MKRFVLIPLLFAAAGSPFAQTSPDARVQGIEKQLGAMRGLPDADRRRVTREVAVEIRKLPASLNKLNASMGLANLSTEGDFGRETLQMVADTLSSALLTTQPDGVKGSALTDAIQYGYFELAQLARYERVTVNLRSQPYLAALQKVDAVDAARAAADFSLTDLDGKTWTLSALKGKIVVVNFWATWCPPCRKEMPDLGEIYRQFKDQGLVVLAISDEAEPVVRKYVTDHEVRYPVLLDPGRKVNGVFQVDGIPKTFFYGRDGKLAAQAMDMRTRGQFLELLARAGLREEKPAPAGRTH